MPVVPTLISSNGDAEVLTAQLPAPQKQLGS
jgi:hypothetical protein